MNKWVKRGLVVGAVGVGVYQSAKYVKNNEYIKERLGDLKNIKEYNDLRIAIMEIIEAFNNPAPRLESHIADDVDAAQDAHSNTHNSEEPLIADAVKRVLDTKVVEDLLGDKADIELMKSLVDESRDVEKLIRGWFN